MTTKQTTETKAKAEKLIGQYEEKLTEIKSFDLTEIESRRLEELCGYFELEMRTFKQDDTASILSQKTFNSIKDQYLTIIEQCRSLIKFNVVSGQKFSAKTKVDAYIQRKRAEAKITELTELKAPVNNSQEAAFERQISTARQELEELKSNQTIEYYRKREIILKIER